MVRASAGKSVCRSSTRLDGRRGVQMEADWGRVSVLEGGGHIWELSLKSRPGINPLWKPHWKTIDPFQYELARHKRAYGAPPDGRLLAGIAGHSLSFDFFGPPSAAETVAGLSTHGEAPSLRWGVQRMSDSPRPTLQYGLVLPEAQIRFSRTLTLDRKAPVVFCEEMATNLATYDRPISWNEHVTFGPPFLECETTIFDMPATRAKVCSASYSERMLVKPDSEFTWPVAPGKDGGGIDLRTTPDQQFGHYTAQLLDPGKELGFVAAGNPKLRFLVVYLFRRADFPWVGNWEERNHRTAAPWRGKTFCRAMEFSTTPFSIPRRETIDQGRLFGEMTYRWLPAKSQVKVRFVILLFDVPDDFRGVDTVFMAEGKAQVVEAGPAGRELKAPVGRFLEAD